MERDGAARTAAQHVGAEQQVPTSDQHPCAAGVPEAERFKAGDENI